jgi:Fe-S-cluster containining protein
MGHPPFLLELNGGVPEPIGGDDSAADYHRLVAAPAAAQAAYLGQVGTINAPCSWLDTAKKCCRYYEFRPDICRTFKVGGKWCSQYRELHQID